MCILYVEKALDGLLRRNIVELPLADETKIVIISDLHRGLGDWADDLQHNAQIYLYALNYYLGGDFTYIELGDGDELYENKSFSDIVRAHGDIFDLLNAFYKRRRFYYLVGNHNSQISNRRWLRRSLIEARSHIADLFNGLEDEEIEESLKLGSKIFLFHGHQGDPINDSFAWLGRTLVRYLWRPLQNNAGFKDPTSPAQNFRKRNRIEDKIFKWAQKNKLMVIAGHTHCPMFCSLSKQHRLAGRQAKPKYFNCGSGVHPSCVTCLEIEDMEITLVKWEITSDPISGQLKVVRVPLDGCRDNLNDILRLL
jgi:UDP-2,3-diacylglucosamine pyrophosphatase LpxH